MNGTRLLSALALAYLLAIGAAYAADTTVDIAPLIREVLLPIASALGMVLATWISAKIAELLKIRRDDALAVTVEQALRNGLAFAQSRLEDKIGSGPISIDVKRQIVADAATYAVAHVPGALKKLGVTPKVLQEKLTARLELNVQPPEVSIAVPTPPAPGGRS